MYVLVLREEGIAARLVAAAGSNLVGARPTGDLRRSARATAPRGPAFAVWNSDRADVGGGGFTLRRGEGAAMGEVRTTTDEALLAEREKLLNDVGRDEASLRADAARGALSGDEWYALERLDVIAFLLGEPAYLSA
ncbi:hypothetical protein [Microbacterium sp.]|uniref:hypothetical protein n=1 Tax=Microbacterium sp. TaxID=51671 RepID=UPI0028114F3A|nr:hypothetical protein [Microbacterium sp.]